MKIWLRSLGLMTGLIILAVIGFLSERDLRRVTVDTGWVDHTHRVLAAIARVRLLVTEAASSRRGFVTTGSPADREKYASSQSQIDLEIKNLGELVPDNPVQRANVRKLIPAIAQWRAVLDASIADHDREGYVLSAQNDFTEQARPRMAAIHEIARRMQDEEESLLGARQSAARASAQRTREIVIGGNILGILLLIAATSLILQENRARRRAEDRIRAEVAERRRTEDRYQTLFTSIDDGFCIIEMIFDEQQKPVDYRFLEVNPSFEKQTGLVGAVGRTMREIAPLHEEHWFETYGRIALTGEPLRFQNRAEQLNRWYDVYAFRFGKAEDRQVAILFHDITERHQLEEGLRETRELVEMLGENVRDYSIFLLDNEGRIQTWNHGAQRMKGYAASEILGKPLSIFYTPEDVEARKPEEALRRAASEGRWTGVGERVRKDGSRFWADVVITAIPGENGQTRGFMKITRNVDDKHASEERMQRQAAELAAANKELEAFSYSVSHDLRAPLRAIDGFSQALLEDSADRLDESGKRHLERVRAGAQRMAELIDDLLSLSHVVRQSLSRKPIDLSELAGEAFESLQREEPGRKVVFQAPGEVMADADPGLLRIVLQNLIGNAWKFTSRREDARIEFGVRTDDGKRRYFVRDNGAGFDMAFSNKLFGAFQRLHGTEDFPGTGIGLATVARIVHRHGGEVGAEGRVGHGATVWFTLGD